MFTIEMLPASYGDCLWIEHGERTAPHRILVDGGLMQDAAAIRARIARVGGPCVIDLAVVTHIDLDHIGGLVALLRNMPEGLTIEQIWFNGDRKAEDLLGTRQGDELITLIRQRRIPWNSSDGLPDGWVVVPDDGPLTVDLPGGARAIVLTPGEERLRALVALWRSGSPEREEPEAGGDLLGDETDVERLARKDSKFDRGVPNGSSIAFVLEAEGKRALLTGDAWPETLVPQLARLASPGKRYLLDAFKLSHHGGKHNTTKALIEAVDCRDYLVSSSGGNRHYHPDAESIARVLRYGGTGPKRLHFNYASDHTRRWRDEALKDRWNYQASYPAPGNAGCVLTLVP